MPRLIPPRAVELLEMGEVVGSDTTTAFAAGTSMPDRALAWMRMRFSGYTGDACNGLTGLSCDYPNSNPAFHLACFCAADADASTGSTWICLQLGPCPASQPPYSLTNACPGVAFCNYDSTRCTCWSLGDPWICGLGGFLPDF
jgi:hypothetical protein